MNYLGQIFHTCLVWAFGGCGHFTSSFFTLDIKLRFIIVTPPSKMVTDSKNRIEIHVTDYLSQLYNLKMIRKSIYTNLKITLTEKYMKH